MSRIIAIANVKGGVAKTTTAINLAAALQERGRRVLAVDLDPQASLTLSLGFNPDGLKHTIGDALDGRAVPLDSVILKSAEGIALAPANRELHRVGQELEQARERVFALRQALGPVCSAYDYILLDCPANAGIMTGLALTAADQVLIPMTPDYLAIRTLDWLLAIIRQVRKTVNPNLRLAGCLISMYDPRTRHARIIAEALENPYDAELPLFGNRIKYSVRAKDAAAAGQSVLRFAPKSDVAASFRALAAEIEQGVLPAQRAADELESVLTLARDAAAHDDPVAAYASFCQAADASPNLLEAWLGRADNAPEWDDALQSYARAAALAPDDPTIHARLERTLEWALTNATQTEAEKLVAIAGFFVERGAPKYAERLYRRATELEPANVTAWLGCAQTTPNAQDAIKCAQRCLELAADNAAAQQVLAQAQARQRDQVQRILDQAAALERDQERERACALYRQATELDPENDRAWVGCATTAADERQGLEYARRALQINPENEKANELARTLAQAEEKEEQAAAAAPAVTKRPVMSFVLALVVIIVFLAILATVYLLR